MHPRLANNQQADEVSHLPALLQVSLLYLVGILGVSYGARNLCNYVFGCTFLTGHMPESTEGQILMRGGNIESKGSLLQYVWPYLPYGRGGSRGCPGGGKG